MCKTRRNYRNASNPSYVSIKSYNALLYVLYLALKFLRVIQGFCRNNKNKIIQHSYNNISYLQDTIHCMIMPQNEECVKPAKMKSIEIETLQTRISRLYI